MDTKFNFETEDQARNEERIVYVRPVAVADLPEELRAQAMGLDHLYAVHDENGAPLALVRDRQAAFRLARENEVTALSVH